MRVPFNEIKDNPITPVAEYRFLIESLEPEAGSARHGEKEGNLRYVMHVRGTNTEIGEVTHYERFFVGSDDDPDALDPTTWTAHNAYSAQALARVLRAAEVNLDQEMEDVCREAPGKGFYAPITHRVGGKGTKSEGQTFAQFGRTARSLAEGPAMQNGGAPIAPKVAPRAAAPPPAASAPAPAARRSPPPAGAPANAPVPTAALKPRAVVAAAPAAAEPTVPCSLCGEQIARSQFKGHVAMCATRDTTDEE